LWYDELKGAGSIVLQLASWINAEQTGMFFGHHAILVFSAVLLGMFAAGRLIRALEHLLPAWAVSGKASGGLIASSKLPRRRSHLVS